MTMYAVGFWKNHGAAPIQISQTRLTHGYQIVDARGVPCFSHATS